MERTIERLLEIEEKAALIINRANDEKIRLHDEFEIELDRMEKDINMDNDEKIHEFQVKIDKELDNEKKQLTLKSEKQLKELDELYQKSHESIAQKVFQDIIKQ